GQEQIDPAIDVVGVERKAVSSQEIGDRHVVFGSTLAGTVPNFYIDVNIKIRPERVRGRGRMEAITDSSPYICITSDTHAGAAIDTYGEYLDPSYREDFKAWRGTYKNPHKKHIGSQKKKK